jgi:DNA-binding NtrC family response regulator
MNPVWIIDDDRSIRWVLEKALGREDIAAKSFGSADEALAALDAGQSRRCWSPTSACRARAASNCCAT